MRRPLLVIALAVVALAAAACSSSSTPGWTYAPPTPAPSGGASAAPPSGGASAAPSGGASAVPSGGASAAPSGGASAAPSAAAGGTVVQVSAINIAFEQTEVHAPADTGFTIHFNNKEAVLHNVAIRNASGAEVFKGDTVTGPIEINYLVPPLPAGTYQFFCSIHANMTGTLIAGG